MVTSIINNDNSFSPPIPIDGVEMLNHLHNEQQEGITVILTFIDRIEHIALIAYPSNDTKLTRSPWQSCLVLDAFSKPTSLSVLSQGNNAFINVDDLLLALHVCN
jgi:hypothetical protein